mgnify:CR=1 FL=1
MLTGRHIRNKIETLYCEHSLIYSRQRLGFDMEKELSKSEIKNFKPVLQPLVRKIKENNRKTIYLSKLEKFYTYSLN